ncbi:hypothetical protein [Halomonas sp. KM-1]|uniref:hypothetical protein n=1 Tax=Halomonas sp. KM-1 TaxID=590061 RepID=UPI0011467831|nr:hypothetical protein [Halomonas sp. KM-1]
MKSSNEDISHIIQTRDPFKISVLGFSAIEEALEQLIQEALPSPHKLETQRLSPSFKVDLAIGLGVFPHDFKGIVIKLSKIRNAYAHEFDLKVKPFKSSELVSAMPEEQRTSVSTIKNDDEDIQVLSFSVFTTYIEVTSRIKYFRQVRAERVRKFAQLKATLEEIPQPIIEQPSEYYINYSKDLDERIKKRQDLILENMLSKKT